MDSVAYLMGGRMSELTANLDVVAANLANADTPGFKRATCCFSEALRPLLSAADASASASAFAPDWCQLRTGSTDFSQGSVRMTGRPLDLAIRGPGFLVVDTPAGQRYTRKGRICLNAEGELTDGNGNRFVADSGALRIPEDAEDISVSRSGEVMADEEVLGRLLVVDIRQPERLVAEGSSLYRNDGPRAAPAVGAEVVQGAIEQSNVNVVNEAISLVQIMRAYETASRILKRMDALNGQLVRSAA